MLNQMSVFFNVDFSHLYYWHPLIMISLLIIGVYVLGYLAKYTIDLLVDRSVLNERCTRAASSDLVSAMNMVGKALEEKFPVCTTIKFIDTPFRANLTQPLESQLRTCRRPQLLVHISNKETIPSNEELYSHIYNLVEDRLTGQWQLVVEEEMYGSF